MEKITLEIHEDAVAVINRIKAASTSEIELEIPNGSVLFENGLNLRLIKKVSENVSKKITFSTIDVIGKSLIAVMEDPDSPVEASSDFVSSEVSLDSVLGESKTKRKLPKLTLKIPTLPRLPKFGLKGPPTQAGKKLFIPILILLLLGGGGFAAYNAYQTVPKAEIKVVVNSQPLIKSVEISVESGAQINIEGRVLPGTLVDGLIVESKTTSTSGEKIVGEFAQGKIKIINRTTTDKDFEDGEEVYSQDDDDLYYVLDDDVTVPGAALEDPLDILSPLIPGSAEVNVTAVVIGEDYNLDDGETLEFDDYNTSDYIADVAEDIDGGSSETIKVVDQLDIDTLSSELFAEIEEKGEGVVESGLGQGLVLVSGLAVGTLGIEEYSAELGDEVDELTLTQTVNFQGLAYKQEDLEKLLEDLLEEFIPDGFELSSEEKEISAEVLGNTDATILSLFVADLQATVKSFVVPEIDEDDIKEDLVGKKVSDAEEILGKVRNVKSYEINLDPNIPFISRIPANSENISVEVKRE